MSELTRNAMEYIEEHAAPKVLEIGGETYVDKAMSRIHKVIPIEYLSTCTLSSIVDYITSETDKKELPDSNFVIHVSDFNCVHLYKELNAEKDRDELIRATIDMNGFRFGRFMWLEDFIINVQSSFVHDDNIRNLLGFIGSVKDDSSVTQNDDGITQNVTVKTGISLVSKCSVPNPITLRPYRTFPEIEQPKSSFIFRVHKNGGGVEAALFGADGEMWKHAAIQSIKEYFKTALNDRDDVIILA